MTCKFYVRGYLLMAKFGKRLSYLPLGLANVRVK